MRNFRLEWLVLPLLLWLFGPFLLSSTVFNEIAPLHFEFAEKKWFYDNLSQGEWTFLYPFNELGHGLLNNPASGLLFLPNFLHVFLPYPVAAKVLFLGHMLLLYFGWRRLLRHFTTPEQASGLGLVGLSVGIVTSLPMHVGLGYISFLPWVVAWVIELWKGKPQLVALSLGSSALFLLGDPFLIPLAWIAGTALAFERTQLKKAMLTLFQVTGLTVLICLPHLLMMALNAPFSSRALGIEAFEALSYSTAPERWIDWLVPSFRVFDTPIPQLEGWWFPRIGGGFVLTGLMILGLRRSPPRQRWVLGFWLLFFCLLSLGKYFGPASWMIQQLPIRYPERFLAYLLPAVLVLAALGLRVLPRKWALALVALALLENGINPRRPELLKEVVTDVPRELWVGDELHQTRYLACPEGLSGRNSFQHYDVRAYQIPMVDGTSNTRSAVLKMVSCPWALSPHVQQWLGIGHVISTGTSSVDPTWGLKKERQLAAGEIFRAQGSPWRARGLRDFEYGEVVTQLPPSPDDIRRLKQISEEGRSFVNPRWRLIDGRPQHSKSKGLDKWSCEHDFVSLVPDLKQQSFRLKVPSGCSGLLSVPWAFQAGWRVSPPSEIVRVNDGTIGLQVSASAQEISLSYRPLGGTSTVVFSILIQLILFGTIVFRFLKKRNH